MSLNIRPRYKNDFTSEEAARYLHAVFNQEHHSDVRAEEHTYTNRMCLQNTIEGLLVELRRKQAVLEEEDDHDTNTEYHDIVKRVARLEKDKAVLQADQDVHFPHYAFVKLAAAYIEGHPFPPTARGDNLDVLSAQTVVSVLAERLANKLVGDTSLENKQDALDNMAENLKSDAARAHDSLDRLASTNWTTLIWQIDNPDALYAVLIQPPPQTGSAAIRGQQEAPAEPPTEGAGG